MRKRNILTLLVCSVFFFGLITLVFANNNGLQLINDGNNKMEACFDVAPTVNSPIDIITTTTGSETIDWILDNGIGSSITHYWVQKNGSDYITPQTWSTDELHIAIDRSVIGVFEYNITCNNTSDMKGSDVVIVTVTAVPPSTYGPLEIMLITGVSLGAIGGIGVLLFIGKRKQ